MTGLAWPRPSLANGADCTPVSQGNRDTAAGQEGQLGGAGQAGRRGETTRRSEELTQPGAAAGPAWQGPSRLARSVSVPVPLRPRRLQVKDTGPAPLRARCALCSEGPNPSPAPPPSSPREALPGLAPRLPARRPVSLFSRPPKAASVLASSVCSLGCWGLRQAGPGAPCPAQHLRLLTFSARQLAGGRDGTAGGASSRKTRCPAVRRRQGEPHFLPRRISPRHASGRAQTRPLSVWGLRQHGGAGAHRRGGHGGRGGGSPSRQEQGPRADSQAETVPNSRDQEGHAPPPAAGGPTEAGPLSPSQGGAGPRGAAGTDHLRARLPEEHWRRRRRAAAGGPRQSTG